MGTDEQNKKANDAPPAKASEALDSEEAKRQAFRKLKPVGPIMKALSKEEIESMLYDPEDKEREHLLDAMPKGEVDDQDPSNP